MKNTTEVKETVKLDAGRLSKGDFLSRTSYMQVVDKNVSLLYWLHQQKILFLFASAQRLSHKLFQHHMKQSQSR